MPHLQAVFQAAVEIELLVSRIEETHAWLEEGRQCHDRVIDAAYQPSVQQLAGEGLDLFLGHGVDVIAAGDIPQGIGFPSVGRCRRSLIRRSDRCRLRFLLEDLYYEKLGYKRVGSVFQLVDVVEPVTTVRFDTPAGLVRCDVEVRDGNVGSVSFENVDSFLLHEHVPIRVAEFGDLVIDIAYGGDMYAFVDADALGLELSVNNDARLIDAWLKIRAAVGEQVETVHPEDPRIDRCYQVLFTSENKTTGDYRQTITVPPGTLDRSPCGTGASARIALLLARGQVGLNEPKRFEGPLGTWFCR